jgi:hypothetical protein
VSGNFKVLCLLLFPTPFIFCILWQEKTLLQSRFSYPPGQPAAGCCGAGPWSMQLSLSGSGTEPLESGRLCNELRGGLRSSLVPWASTCPSWGSIFFPLRLGVLCRPRNRLGCLQLLPPERKGGGGQGGGGTHLKAQFQHPIKTTVLLIKNCKIYSCQV